MATDGQAVPPVAAAADRGADSDVEVALESLGQWQLAWRRFKRHRLAMAGLAIFLLMIVVAIVGPIVAPYNPLNIPNSKIPGGEPPSLAHLFGTDISEPKSNA